MKARLLYIFLWLSLLTGTLAAQTVYITNTGQKYHASGCRCLSKSKISVNLSEALAQGYTACKICRPAQTPGTNAEAVTESQQATENSPHKAASAQCTATTKTGQRCKHRTKSNNGRCWQHGGN